MSQMNRFGNNRGQLFIMAVHVEKHILVSPSLHIEISFAPSQQSWVTV